MAISRPGGSLPARLPSNHGKLFNARHMADGSIVIAGPPAKRPGKVSGWKLRQRLIMAWTANQTKILEPVMRQTCEELAKGTKWTWRDVATMMILGTYYAIEYPDGTLIQGYRMTQPDPQFILDLVSAIKGAMLVRTDLGWEGISGGVEGQAPIVQPDGSIAWAAPQVLAGLHGSWQAPMTGTLSTTAHATKGYVLTPLVNLQISRLWVRFNPVAGSTYFARLWSLNTLTLATALTPAFTIPWTSTGDQQVVVALPAAIDLAAASRYAILVTRSDSSATAVCTIPAVAGGAITFPVTGTSGFASLDSVAPAVGNTLSAVTTGLWPVGFDF